MLVSHPFNAWNEVQELNFNCREMREYHSTQYTSQPSALWDPLATLPTHDKSHTFFFNFHIYLEINS